MKTYNKLLNSEYSVSETITLNGKQYVPISKNDTTYFYRLENQKCKSLTKEDQAALYNALGLIAKSPSSNTKVLVYVQGIAVVMLLTTLLTLTSCGFTSTREPISKAPIEIITSDPTSTPTIATSPEFVEEVIINHQIAKEAVIPIDIFNIVIEKYFSDYPIKEEPNRSLVVGIYDEEDFESDVVADYNSQAHVIRIKTMKNIWSIFHELFHSRTADFRTGDNGSTIEEAITSLLSEEFFCDTDGYYYEREMLKILIEILGIDNTIKPYLNDGTIDDIKNAIDNLMQEDGYGHTLFDYMDQYQYIRRGMRSPNDNLSKSQIMMINMYFVQLYNKINNANTRQEVETIIREMFEFKYVLITASNTDEDTQVLNVDLDRVEIYYENKKQQLIANIIDANADYSPIIETIASSIDGVVTQDYFQNKRYVYHGEYVNQYFVQEIINPDGSIRVSVNYKKIAKYPNYENYSILYRKAKVDEIDGKQIITEMSFEVVSLDNYPAFYNLIQNNMDLESINYTITPKGVINDISAFKDDKIINDIILSSFGEKIPHYTISRIQRLDGTSDLVIAIDETVNINPDYIEENVTYITKVEKLENNEVTIVELSSCSLKQSDLELAIIEMIRQNPNVKSIYCDLNELGYITRIWKAHEGEDYQEVSLSSIAETQPFYVVRQIQKLDGTYILTVNIQEGIVLNSDNQDNKNIFYIYQKEEIVENKEKTIEVGKDYMNIADLNSVVQEFITSHKSATTIFCYVNEYGQITNLFTAKPGEDWQIQFLNDNQSNTNILRTSGQNVEDDFNQSR